jgi:hypothetical protein
MQAAEPTRNDSFFEITTLMYQYQCHIHTKYCVYVCSVNYTPTKLFNDCIPGKAEENRLPGTHNGQRTCMFPNRGMQI